MRRALDRATILVLGRWRRDFADGRLWAGGRDFKRVWRIRLWLLDRRYRAAERLGGAAYAKQWDYIPF